MKSIYTDIAPATGSHKAGICSLYVAPKEWLAADPVIDFETGVILQAIQLHADKFWIQIDLLEDSYVFSENPKESKSGDYRETSLGGTLNFYNSFLQQILQTLRRHELIGFVTDTNKRRRIIGDADTAMRFTFSHLHKNGQDREESVAITLDFQSEDPAPFYNPDGEPEIRYNLLENIDGNFLLVE